MTIDILWALGIGAGVSTGLCAVLVALGWAWWSRSHAATMEALQRIEASLLQGAARTEAQLAALTQQLHAAAQSAAAQQEALRKAVDDRLEHAAQESRQGRTELHTSFQHFEGRQDAGRRGLEQLVAQRLDTVLEQAQALQTQLQDRLSAQAQSQLQMQEALQATLRTVQEASSSALQQQFLAMQQSFSQQWTALAQGAQHSAEQLRATVNERLGAMQTDNASKLEAMRQMVDEKLHATLEQRLGASFQLVSERLEQVQQGLGEMKTLAGSVGDLKRVMTNVKTRGVWGEMQLGAILEDVLTPEQYARNVKPCPRSNEIVEFAIRLPGKREDQPVWLPVDSKYPVEHYQRLMDAHDAADKTAIVQAAAGFEASIRQEAKRIATKYLCPPQTTDFAILYLPSESLYAEALRRPGLVGAIQHEHRIIVAGPANLAAMLNSLQLGFRTLAIEKRSSEVWNLLAVVKTEFAKFGDVIDATKRSIDQAAKKFDEVGQRTRAIQRKLSGVAELPLTVADTLAVPAVPEVSSDNDDSV
ncbi:DNA recombination protein RmuC [Candidatus Symbiobacter mobilis]|uniref:DNA recombination protein RmuC n=1 Tax=Candidatus Symbiobacter mobilis CR TaxID=946483 RepID=U5N5Q2_9BURK|nr:DNA recombination protein RmuC [Candidatus Symbiobacter mobilis]AGX86826.1 DNA recombination protein RmuC [Candidatus Symbiobacter mobilis CR]